MSLDSLALLTDFYQLTMLGGYFESGKLQQDAVFDLYFRKIPHKGGYCVAAGLETALSYLEGLSFEGPDLDYLRSLGTFSPKFLRWLRDFRFEGTVYAMPEGTLVFPGEPILRVHARLPEAQLVESALLNIINFQTLIATKAARICRAAGKTEVLEFGLRRAQGVDGALSASRAAYIGGCGATSNSLAGRLYGIPVRGTQAHSWVMSFSSELEAFRAYARAYPDGCLLLVDTYDTLESGVPNAIAVGRELARGGHKLAGIRLDSGDMAALSKRAREMLDQGGLSEAHIVASNDLDEYAIESLLEQGARIDSWGVGTRLVTSMGESALGGVYKLAVIGNEPRIKVSSEPAKVTCPGVKQVWRASGPEGAYLGDALALEGEPVETWVNLHDPREPGVPSPLVGHFEPLLSCVMERGRAQTPPTLSSVRERTLAGLGRLSPESTRLRDPAPYRVGWSPQLYELRARLLEAARA